MGLFADAYRFIPSFKGKKRIGSVLFKKSLFKNSNQIISGKRKLKYAIINTHDSVGRDLFFNGIYEPQTIRFIEENLSKGDVMIDAGANIGAISLPVAKRHDVKIFAFEPAHHIFETLEQNIKVNHLQNVEALPMALSDKSGEVDFYESNRVHGWSGIVKIDSFQHYKVAATSLDAFAEDKSIKNIAVLKADVQGWEYHLFRGAERLLSEKRIRNIIFEFEWWAEQNAGLKAGTAQQFLMDKGYKLFTLDGTPVLKPLTKGTVILKAGF